jgi:hypothetical protein
MDLVVVLRKKIRWRLKKCRLRAKTIAMTEAQAHNFLSTYKKNPFGLRSDISSEKEAFEIAGRNSRSRIVMGITFSALPVLDYMWDYFDSDVHHFHLPLFLIGLAVLSNSIWLSVRIRQVRQALQGKV